MHVREHPRGFLVIDYGRLMHYCGNGTPRFSLINNSRFDTAVCKMVEEFCVQFDESHCCTTNRTGGGKWLIVIYSLNHSLRWFQRTEMITVELQ